MYRALLKPLIDVAIAVFALICLSPVFIILTILLFIANNGKPFFLQPRVGKRERIFKVIKFRTMNDRCDENGNLLPDDVRLTPVGKFVRKTSLDELPQLLNILKGDMSLVGPRPLLVEYLPLYNEQQRTRHNVMPGITGWAQVNGRNTVSWREKFELDTWYVKHTSFVLDIKILFMTVEKVVRSEGINAEGSATVEKFKGDI
jgi:lipopolysaccharide/colanic/teichoic acid biosynthesis glycosyltransferase